MLFSNMNTNIKARPEHLSKVTRILEGGKFLSPNYIVKATGLSLTAVKCSLSELYNNGKLEIIRSEETPKLQVKLKPTRKNCI